MQQVSDRTTDSPPATDAPRPFVSLKLLGAFAVAALTLGYVLLWWNRSFGMSADGVLFYMAERMLDGKIPYRDFYLVVPPWTALKCVALISLAGDYLINARAFAIVERVALAVVIYLWLARLFQVRYAILGAFLSVVIFSGDIADSLANYSSDGSLWAVLAGLTASMSLAARPQSRRLKLAALSGFFAAMTLMTKQTTGLGVTLVIPLWTAVIPARKKDWNLAISGVAAFAAGWLIPCVTLLAWLSHHHAMPQFVDEVFRSGPSSKGPLLTVLTRPFTSTFSDRGSMAQAIVALLVMLAVFIPWREFRVLQSLRSEGWKGLVISIAAVGAALAVGLGLCYSPSFSTATPAILRIPQLTSSYVALIGSAAIFVWLSWRWMWGRLEEEYEELLLLSGISLSIAYMYSLSWMPYEAMALPGIGMVVCLALAGLKTTGRTLVTALALGMISLAVAMKLLVPFNWVNWTEPPVTAPRAANSIPGLRGFNLSRKISGDLDRIVGAIDRNSTPSDTVFVFPYYAQFYILAHRNPPTFAYAHWLDVVPDKDARRDADLVRGARPAVLVFLDMPDLSFVGGEQSFRAKGTTSGQTYMLATLRSMAAGYTLVDSIPVDRLGENILIYARDRISGSMEGRR